MAAASTAKPIRWDYKLQARRQQLFDAYSQLAGLRNNSWYKDVFTANNIALIKILPAL